LSDQAGTTVGPGAARRTYGAKLTGAEISLEAPRPGQLGFVIAGYTDQVRPGWVSGVCSAHGAANHRTVTV